MSESFQEWLLTLVAAATLGVGGGSHLPLQHGSPGGTADRLPSHAVSQTCHRVTQLEGHGAPAWVFGHVSDGHLCSCAARRTFQVLGIFGRQAVWCRDADDDFRSRPLRQGLGCWGDTGGHFRCSEFRKRLPSVRFVYSVANWWLFALPLLFHWLWLLVLGLCYFRCMANILSLLKLCIFVLASSTFRSCGVTVIRGAGDARLFRDKVQDFHGGATEVAASSPWESGQRDNMKKKGNENMRIFTKESMTEAVTVESNLLLVWFSSWCPTDTRLLRLFFFCDGVFGISSGSVVKSLEKKRNTFVSKTLKLSVQRE